MYRKRFASVLVLTGALTIGGCGGGEGDAGAVDNTAVSPMDTTEAPSMVTGTVGAPGPGTVGTPGTPSATVPDTIN